MSAISAIYNAPIIQRTYQDLTVEVSIKYKGQVFIGKAMCHENDKDFMSKKVGHTIALSRARIKALEYEYKEAKQVAKIKYALYREVTAYGAKETTEVDPLGVFYKNVSKSLHKVSDLSYALDDEKDYLKEYIEAQATALASIRRFREKDNQN